MKRTLHPAGDFRCTWHVPDEDGGLLNVPGTLSVRPGERPAGDMHSVDLFEPDDLFPQRRVYPVLTATLAGGATALVTDVALEAMLGQASLHGGAAVISVDRFDDGAEPVAYEIEMQIESLDAISGLQPLSPHREADSSWSAKTRPDSSLTWTQGGATVTLDFIVAADDTSPFSLHVVASPRVIIRSETPLALSDWITEWVEPMQRICSLASGRSCRVTYVVLRSESGESTQLAQLYAHGITQEAYDSDYREIFGRSVGVNLKDDDASLLGLARGWRQAQIDQHPLIETYGAMLLVDEHPRARFLLLLQALEGAHGYDQRSTFAARRLEHETEVKALLARLYEHTNSKERSKIKNGLKLNHPGLEQALTRTLKSLPFDMQPWFAKTSLVTQVIADEDTDASDVVSALRVVRNDLAHGNRGYDARDLREVVVLLNRVVRAQSLRLFGSSDETLERVLKSGR
ncbi:hypothetical protein J7E68_03185 [Microbacterium sp. ISL-103]|uniref:ApeA N-terminal domain 1-containing protein n=1 Tax=Microbacterium sp. ISL-103 TaxID=2819156 RepID=UPI001BE722EC|nr:hypothetical protein [Microbacterium sp. ISL-103]MBT2473604.1 hypothetical protein [Microbacterium sp. ISL-103]